jgi:hypothetical protein
MPGARQAAAAGAALGIAGGLALLAPLVVEIPGVLNVARIVLYHAGAIAVGLAAYPWQARVSRRVALAASLPLVGMHAWSIGWIVLPAGQATASGALGSVLFAGAIAMWGSTAWFGSLSAGAGILWRGASLLLAGGAVLAVTGMSRLGLTTDAQPTVFAPLSLLGIVCTGVAWVLVGVDPLVLGRARAQSAVAQGGAGSSA